MFIKRVEETYQTKMFDDGGVPLCLECGSVLFPLVNVFLFDLNMYAFMQCYVCNKKYDMRQFRG